MSKLLILSRYADEFQQLIESARLPQLEKITATKQLSGAFSLDEDLDILFGEPAAIRSVLASLPNLRWVQSIWAGVEPLLDASLRRNYLLTNARGVFGDLMSEYVFGYLLLHERRILQRLQAQHERLWDSSITGSLRGKTIGLLGVGSIGTRLAQTAKHFGMAVRGYTRESETCREVDAYYHAPRLMNFVAGLDYLVVVLPNTPATYQLVDAGLFHHLPKHAVFINVGRGTTVDEASLIDALQHDRLALAVLDVLEQEPLPADHPFWNTPNLYMTFHTSAPSLPSDLSRLFIENYLRYIHGQSLLHLVDFEKGY